jgi:predicted small secreted protein
MKFKAGDKVVRTVDVDGNVDTNVMRVGNVYTVERCTDHGTLLYLKDTAGAWFSSNFELYRGQIVAQKNKKHTHADLIVQWANGAVIEQLDSRTKLWKENKNPGWGVKGVYRVKPKEVSPITMKRRIAYNLPSVSSGKPYLTWYDDGVSNVEVTINPETGEVLKIVQI